MTGMTNTAPSIAHWRSYARFLATNRPYRLFWLAGVISQLGNWFNYIAVFVLLTRLSGGGQAVSWFLIAKFLPTTLFGPAAGVLADRLDRRAIMICCDLLRIAVVLAFLAVNRPTMLWLVYLLALLQETLWTFANPARQASVPNLCSAQELRLANALSGATWSLLLAFGAALGGMVTAIWGWQSAIVIDAFTFLLSAVLLSRITIASPAAKKPAKTGLASLTGITDLRAGLTYIRQHQTVGPLMLVKSGWALSGGILVMLTVFGEQVFAVAGPGAGSGLLYSFRGIGAAIGPILAWRVLGEDHQAMHHGIGLSFFISAIAYLLFSQAPTLLLALPLVLVGHIGGAIQWVFSTTLLQQRVPDIFRGRVFAAEMALLTLILSLSTYLTGLALDLGCPPRQVVIGLALLFLLPGALWHRYCRRRTADKAD